VFKVSSTLLAIDDR